MAGSLTRPFTLRRFPVGYLKERVYCNRSKTTSELKIAINHEIKLILQEMTKKVMESFRNRLRQCVENGGHHINDVIYKK